MEFLPDGEIASEVDTGFSTQHGVHCRTTAPIAKLGGASDLVITIPMITNRLIADPTLCFQLSIPWTFDGTNDPRAMFPALKGDEIIGFWNLFPRICIRFRDNVILDWTKQDMVMYQMLKRSITSPREWSIYQSQIKCNLAHASTYLQGDDALMGFGVKKACFSYNEPPVVNGNNVTITYVVDVELPLPLDLLFPTRTLPLDPLGDLTVVLNFVPDISCFHCPTVFHDSVTVTGSTSHSYQPLPADLMFDANNVPQGRLAYGKALTAGLTASTLSSMQLTSDTVRLVGIHPSPYAFAGTGKLTANVTPSMLTGATGYLMYTLDSLKLPMHLHDMTGLSGADYQQSITFPTTPAVTQTLKFNFLQQSALTCSALTALLSMVVALEPAPYQSIVTLPADGAKLQFTGNAHEYAYGDAYKTGVLSSSEIAPQVRSITSNLSTCAAPLLRYIWAFNDNQAVTYGSCWGLPTLGVQPSLPGGSSSPFVAYVCRSNISDLAATVTQALELPGTIRSAYMPWFQLNPTLESIHRHSSMDNTSVWLSSAHSNFTTVSSAALQAEQAWYFLGQPSAPPLDLSIGIVNPATTTNWLAPIWPSDFTWLTPRIPTFTVAHNFAVLQRNMLDAGPPLPRILVPVFGGLYQAPTAGQWATRAVDSSYYLPTQCFPNLRSVVRHLVIENAFPDYASTLRTTDVNAIFLMNIRINYKNLPPDESGVKEMRTQMTGGGLTLSSIGWECRTQAVGAPTKSPTLQFAQNQIWNAPRAHGILFGVYQHDHNRFWPKHIQNLPVTSLTVQVNGDQLVNLPAGQLPLPSMPLANSTQAVWQPAPLYEHLGPLGAQPSPWTMAKELPEQPQLTDQWRMLMEGLFPREKRHIRYNALRTFPLNLFPLTFADGGHIPVLNTTTQFYIGCTNLIETNVVRPQLNYALFTQTMTTAPNMLGFEGLAAGLMAPGFPGIGTAVGFGAGLTIPPTYIQGTAAGAGPTMIGAYYGANPTQGVGTAINGGMTVTEIVNLMPNPNATQTVAANYNATANASLYIPQVPVGADFVCPDGSNLVIVYYLMKTILYTLKGDALIMHV